MVKIHVTSPAIRYNKNHIEADYDYQTSEVTHHGEVCEVIPKTTRVTFRTESRVPRTGVMLVGWGGNNGTTVTAAILANKRKLTWRTKEGLYSANYFGSITQASTVSLGHDAEGKEIFAPMNDLVPMLHPNDIILDGWDISSMNLADAMERAKVLDWQVQQQLRPEMEKLRPRPGIYDHDFIAANQEDRADNVIHGTKFEQMEHIRNDIRDFKAKNNLEKVLVLWTANTERFTVIVPGVNDTADNLLSAIKRNESEIAPSTLYAVACALEGCTYINGSPQNTFVPGLLELAERQGTFIAGDDFKSGQTKFKSVLVDFLVSAGIKPVSIVSYNHLGNNDGKNLSAPAQFRSKEISKSNVVDDMVASNKILFPTEQKPDHCVVIKYVPYVGDSKRALDEYTSELMMGGKNTIVVHNTCEDSLLATPIILDLLIVGELCERVKMRVGSNKNFQSFHSILTLLSYMCKAPLVPKGAPLVNALFKQRSAIENFLRACIALPPLNHMDLEHKLSQPEQWTTIDPVVQVEDVVVQKTTFVAREGIRTA